MATRGLAVVIIWEVTTILPNSDECARRQWCVQPPMLVWLLADVGDECEELTSQRSESGRVTG